MNELEETARNIRIWSLKAIHAAKSGHPGGCLSCADILAYLYTEVLRKQDRFILSKGHAAPTLYAALAECGLIEHEELLTLRKLGSRLQGHPHLGSLPYVNTSTGSLGQGFSVACGMALGMKYAGSDGRVYVLLGDGELQEGIVWEAAMFAAHYNLDNLVAIVDYNGCQSDDWNDNIMGIEPLGRKWMAFGWFPFEVEGHNFDQLEYAFDTILDAQGKKHELPIVIIAHTIKGRGVSYMTEDPTAFHGSLKLSDEQLRIALEELSKETSEAN